MRTMTWEEGIDRYEARFRNGRVVKEENLWRYVPKKYEEAVERIFSSSDGYWIWLHEDWYFTHVDCSSEFAFNINDLRSCFKYIRHR